MELNGYIDDSGTLKLYRREELNTWIKQNSGKKVTVSVSLAKKKRSNPQSAYYWGVCVPMIQEAINSHGNEFSKELVHEFLKKEFNSKEIEVSEGYYLSVPGSTTDMSTTDFMDYIMKIQEFASSILNIYIPNPNETLEINF